MNYIEVREIDVTDLAGKAGLDESVLVTRPSGRKFLPILKEVLLNTEETTAIVLDFRGVKMMDASFADEVFAALAARRSRRNEPARCLVLRALPPAGFENLEMALTSRPFRESGVRNCVMPVITEVGRSELIGKAEGHVVETFDLLRRRGSLTTRDVAQEWQLGIPAASTRLKAIYDLGLAVRSETRILHGKEYVYAWPL